MEMAVGTIHFSFWRGNECSSDVSPSLSSGLFQTAYLYDNLMLEKQPQQNFHVLML